MATKKILAIVESAYRATLEEQDDPVIWLAHALRGAGSDIDVLLTGHAVNYGVKAQDAGGLVFGEKRQTQPPRLAQDLASLARKGARVLYVEEDARALGIGDHEVIDEVKAVASRSLPGLLEEYGQVWRW